MKMIIDNKEIIEVKIAKNMFQRMKGLMGKKEVREGLYFYPCNNIHTLFMKVSIDVLYLDANGVIIALTKAMKPWKIGKIIRKGKVVIELPEGTIEHYNIKEKQVVSFLK